MASRPVSRTMPPRIPTWRVGSTPSDSGSIPTRVKREGQDEAYSPVAEPSSPGAWVPFSSEPSSPATHLPAEGSTHDQPASMSSAPVNQHSLAQYYRDGAYSDLDVVSAGIVRSVHRIVVCSESPVLQTMCRNLGPSQRLELNQYDPETLDRVLDFCYRRTYSDGEYPETVAPFLTRLNAAEVRDALETPIAIIRDVQHREDCYVYIEQNARGKKQSPDEGQISHQEQKSGDGDTLMEDQRPGEENDRVEDADEYDPESCDIDFDLDYDSDSSSVTIPSRPRSPMNLPQLPYATSLFANFKVYIAAKDLKIPALQLVARERFAHTLRINWDRVTILPQLIERVYLDTDESDPLRVLICQIVAAAYPFGMASRAEIRELMTKNGKFAAEVLDSTIRLGRGWADTWA